MSENTKIEWADHTFNPWIGCTKVSPMGCANCYAEADFDKRRHRVVWGAGQPRSRTKTWGEPVRWNKTNFYECSVCGWRGSDKDDEFSRPKKGCIHILAPARQRVFCASLADVFDNEVPVQWLGDLFELIKSTPNLDWLLLTKRIGNWKTRMQAVLDYYQSRIPPTPTPRSVSDEESDAMNWIDAWIRNDVDPIPANVWIGATVVNQEEADRDIPKLLAVPAAKRFLSMEPLLGPVDLTDLIQRDGHGGEHHYSALDCDVDPADDEWSGACIDWVIVGGESGPNARPMHQDWARSVRDQCEAAGVPFLFKQWGEWREPMPGEDFDTSMGRAAKPPAFIISHDGSVRCFEDDRFINPKVVIRVGKKAAGRLLDGREWNGYPY